MWSRFVIVWFPLSCHMVPSTTTFIQPKWIQYLDLAYIFYQGTSSGWRREELVSQIHLPSSETWIHGDVYFCRLYPHGKHLFRFSWHTRYNRRRRNANERDIKLLQKADQCGYNHEEVNDLPQPSHEQEASYRNLEDHEVVPHEAAELPYASRPLGGKEASRLIQAFSQCKALFRLNLTTVNYPS